MSTRRQVMKKPTLQAQEARVRAAKAISLQREHPDWSLTHAATEAGTTVATVRRHMPTALTRTPGGRWQAKAGDRERFTMRVVTVEAGHVDVTVTGSRKRSLVGQHHAAISSYLATGDRRRLDALTGKTVAGYTLQTDPAAIRALHRVGELAFLEIYALTH